MSRKAAQEATKPTFKQSPPKTPEERKAQSEARRNWLREWAPQVAAAEGTVPTLKRAREMMYERFGFVIANAYINEVLRDLRLERGEQPVLPVARIPVAKDPVPEVTRADLTALVVLMRRLRVRMARVSDKWQLQDVSFAE